MNTIMLAVLATGFASANVTGIENKKDQVWLENCLFDDGTQRRIFVYWSGENGSDYILVGKFGANSGFNGIGNADDVEIGIDTVCSRDLSHCSNNNVRFINLSDLAEQNIDLSWKTFQYTPTEQNYEFTATGALNVTSFCSGRRVTGLQCLGVVSYLKVLQSRLNLNLPFNTTAQACR